MRPWYNERRPAGFGHAFAGETESDDQVVLGEWRRDPVLIRMHREPFTILGFNTTDETTRSGRLADAELGNRHDLGKRCYAIKCTNDSG